MSGTVILQQELSYCLARYELLSFVLYIFFRKNIIWLGSVVIR